MTSTISYLEMTSPLQLRPSSKRPEPEFRTIVEPETNARLYREVGASWQWTDRLKWSEQDWHSWVARPELVTWVSFSDDREAGYVELEKQEAGNVEIVYFGLHGSMIGRGLGGAMLARAVREIWALAGTKRIWLHTCSEDHPHALLNYQARGFRIYKTETKEGPD
jgi:GNAT superfamily N-acetyltransferase